MSPQRGKYPSRPRNNNSHFPHNRRHQQHSNQRRYFKNNTSTTSTTSTTGNQTPTNPSNCTICKIQPGKYRCPYCTDIKYCSVACNKIHQSTDCNKSKSTTGGEAGDAAQQTTSTVDSSPLTAEPVIIAPAVDDSTGTARPDYVTAKQLTTLAYDKSTRAALYDKELQHIIQRIDSAADRSGLLERYLRTNSDFRAFVESMIHTIEQ